MITVLFFAKLREDVGVSSLEMPLADIQTIGDVVNSLGNAYGVLMSQALAAPNIIMACNHDVVEKDHVVMDGDEIAFFPPVSGG